MNELYYGDCLDILKMLYKKHPQGFIDLIYIDPPFNSKRNYNILFENADLKDTKAQKGAFADTWSNVSYKDTLEEMKDLDLELFSFIESLDKTSISKSAISYLTTMAIRIWFMQKVLNDKGSFYLHCDPTMSHYLKITCDLIFGKDNFKNEIIWRRSGGFKRSSAKKFPTKHDVILFYSKSENIIFNPQYKPHKENYIKRFKTDEDGRLYRDDVNPTKGGTRTIYLDEVEGDLIDSVWTDIHPVNPAGLERLGYPTQKPEALLERIIKASSKKDSLVADLFCGCGTTIAVAEKLKRNWLGVDISHLAIGLIERRLIKKYTKKIKAKYEIHGMPKDLDSAKKLALEEGGRFKFQDWIIETKIGGVHNPKKTADGGWDGHLTFTFSGKKEIALIEVKSGGFTPAQFKGFMHVVEKQKAALGIWVCFKDKMTKGMRLEAKDCGYFMKEHFKTRYDKIQILTIEELLDGEQIKMPEMETTTFKNAPKDETPEHKQLKLL